MSLSEYRRKRRSNASPEPRGRQPDPSKDGPRFTVQHHAARTDHYDFRLEIDGVLASWAIPKGPSTNPKDKRMARRTEDHPLDYETFEGVIPEGECGAGGVIVWDRGTYTNETDHEMGEALKCVRDQEFVIGGDTAPEGPKGSRVGRGALLVGYHDGGDLVYAGKVGTGFDDATLRSLHERMSAIAQNASPFTRGLVHHDVVRETS